MQQPPQVTVPAAHESGDLCIRLPAQAVACAGSSAVGVLGGLIGLGGAELRIPLLVGWFRLSARHAVPLNLLVSLATVVAVLLTRLALGRLPAAWPYDIEIGALAAGALVGAWWGIRIFRRVSDYALHRIVGYLLLALGVLLLLESVIPFQPGSPLGSEVGLRSLVGVGLGVAIGIVSSLLGVAGGELIIPTLVFVFGVDIGIAGTCSLLISLPAMLLGISRHRQTGAYLPGVSGRHLLLALGFGAVVGSAAGSLMAAWVATDALKALLGMLLLASAVKLLRHR